MFLNSHVSDFPRFLFDDFLHLRSTCSMWNYGFEDDGSNNLKHLPSQDVCLVTYQVKMSQMSKKNKFLSYFATQETIIFYDLSI